MKKILTTAVFAMALALVANAYDKTVSTFETDSVAELFAEINSGAATWSPVNYTAYKGLLPSETGSSKCLDVSTDSELFRKANSFGTAETVKDNFYIDMMAKFNETESAQINEEDKLAIFMNASGKLVVVAGADTNVCVTTTPLSPDTWYRVTIRMIEDISTIEGSQPGFVVSINGSNVAAAEGSYLDLAQFSLNETAQSYYTKKELFPTITGDATIKGLALTGVGSVDEIVFRTEKAMDTDVINPYDEVDFSKVTYTIVDAHGDPVKIGNEDATPKTVDYLTLPTGVYSVQASADGEKSQTVGEAVGVINLADTATDVLISVPWKTADGDNPTVADIVDESSLSNGDTLSVYSAAEQQFVSFTYNNGAWARTVDNVETTMDVNTVIAPGSAAYLHRTDTTQPIRLIGKVASVGGATPEGGTSSAAKW